MMNGGERIRVRMDLPGETANPTLSDEDEIRVFEMDDFRKERFVSIGGAVRKPVRVLWTQKE